MNTMATAAWNEAAAPAQIATDPAVFTNIYEATTHIAVWQRQLNRALAHEAQQLVDNQPNLQASFTVAPHDVSGAIQELANGDASTAALSEDISQLVDMFCCLFDLQRAGLRLTTLSHAMCPRFHVDKVPCRLVTTYSGTATQWLPNHLADRSKLGAGSANKPDEESGLFHHPDNIEQLHTGDVALLKGELWHNNAGAGLIHRSPAVPSNTRRLLLTLDFSD